jgi:L-glyceraldehyde 3-phosphate reductase
MLSRWVEHGLLDVLEAEGIGCIAFCPLAQGLLTNKYLNGIPEGSRASKPHGFLRPQQVTDEVVSKVRKLNDIAAERGQSLAQMSLAWVLRDPRVTSALIGASSVKQIEQNVGTLTNLQFDTETLAGIDEILASAEG